MVNYWFDQIEGAENQALFDGLRITSCGEKYRAAQGSCPVVLLSLKDVKFQDWESTYAALIDLITRAFDRSRALLQAGCLSELEKRTYCRKMLDKTASPAEYCLSLAKLTAFLHKSCQKPVILRIDEYDTPIQAGYVNGFYPEIIEFIRAWLSEQHASEIRPAVGILRVAKRKYLQRLKQSGSLHAAVRKIP